MLERPIARMKPDDQKEMLPEQDDKKGNNAQYTGNRKPSMLSMGGARGGA